MWENTVFKQSKMKACWCMVRILAVLSKATQALIKTSALIEFWFNVITLRIIYKVAQYIFV